MPHIRELGFDSTLPPGTLNAITDVPSVAVGHFTLVQGEGGCQPGHGPFRTGVTVVLPHQGNLYLQKAPAAVHTINGFGKAIGFEQVRELGHLETPIALTGTLNAPRVADALISLAIEQNPQLGSINAVVGETNDGFLSDIQGRPIGLAEVRAAMAAASTGAVAEGAVGAGTGTSCFGWKGGIGTASRKLPEKSGGFTVGVLVQSNFGSPPQLTIAGIPVGKHLQPPYPPISHLQTPGSIMIILATDAPLDSRQLGRLCRRAVFGLARTGSSGHGGSGDFVIAFSTAYCIPQQPAIPILQISLLHEWYLDGLFTAVIESVEEAIYNSLLMAHTVIGRDGNTRYALPADKVQELMKLMPKG